MRPAGRQPPFLACVLFPILESASLEDDPDLRRMWATMLANAADSVRVTDMMPAYAAILAELTPIEAVILEAVYSQQQDGEVRLGYNPAYSGRGKTRSAA